MFDVFHVGRVRILQRAKAHGDHLTVGLSSEELNFIKKEQMLPFLIVKRRPYLGLIN